GSEVKTLKPHIRTRKARVLETALVSGETFGQQHIFKRRTLLGDFQLGIAIGSLERSEEHTSELQSRENLVCRLLLEKKKNYYTAGQSCAGASWCVSTPSDVVVPTSYS